MALHFFLVTTMGKRRIEIKGTYLNEGHLRYYSPPHLRGKYVHRKIMEDLLEETHPLTRQLLPEAWQVHHMDFDKVHNCPINFLMVEDWLHSIMTSSGEDRDGMGKWRKGRYETRRYRQKSSRRR